MIIMSKNRLAPIAVMMILLLAIIPTALGATPSKYQDEEWLDFYIAQSPQIVLDLNHISAALDGDDYNKLYAAGHRLLIDAGANLKKSKGFKVSPEFKKVKLEYEFSASDHMTAGKYFMVAANKQNAGDIIGSNKALKSAVSYINSCSKHLNNLDKYLDIYTGKSTASQSNSDSSSKSKTRQSNSNSISNTPSIANTGSGSIVGNSNTKVYHNAGCRYVSTIKPEHLHYFKTRKEAESTGYRACKVCGG